MRYPRVSVIVPVFNAADTLARTLRSVVDQDYPNLQLIVIDGCSQDESLRVASGFDQHIDCLVSEVDEGQADALNKGFRLADGEIWTWLCADDCWLPGALETVVSHFDRYPGADVVTGGCVRRFPGRKITTHPDPAVESWLGLRNPIEQPSTFWRAEAHRRAGELDQRLRYAFDWEWWCRLYRVGARFQSIDEPLSEYYFSETNLTSTGGDALARDMREVLRRYGAKNGHVADLYWFLYSVFDKRGFYDAESIEQKPEWQRRLFHLSLGVLHIIFGRSVVDSYNWNFASRQSRGMGWYFGG